MCGIKVSVVVPTFKREEKLKIAIDSLVNQTYKNLEILVVSDNADEIWNKKVFSIFKKTKTKNPDLDIKLIENPTNIKSSASRNVGIFNATGEYITFLDDDDYYLPQKIESQVKKMINDDSKFSITNLKLFNQKGINIDNRNRKHLDNYLTKNELLLYHLKYHLAGTGTMMFEKKYLLSINGFDDSEIGDEFSLILRAILNNGKFAYYDECFVNALVYGESGGISSGESKIKRANNLYEFKKQYYHLLKKKDIRYIKSRHFATLAYAYIRMKQRKKFLKYAFLSFVVSPFSSIKLLFSR